MKTIILIVLLIIMGTLGYAQNVEIQGKAKISVMEPATVSAQQVARESDGTLSLISTETSSFTVGDYVQGGVIFWISDNGKHGKAVFLYDVNSVLWSNIDDVGIGAEARHVNNGAGNTVAIMSQWGHYVSAARQCADLGYAGYYDWYLPSIEELNLIYINRDAIDYSVEANGGEAFANGGYWSSKEEDSTTAWYLDFASGNQISTNKSFNFRVRAIRAFCLPIN